MELIQQNPELSAYLVADEVVDHKHPLVRETAARLRRDSRDAYTYAKAAFEFVRDTIPHSSDTGMYGSRGALPTFSRSAPVSAAPRPMRSSPCCAPDQSPRLSATSV